ncbi:MAG TPA: hypothetical protein VLX92_02225 [Kofleriaceae bacterium]|nr:hypothetical protein [Kofleriaceae bacterium]
MPRVALVVLAACAARAPLPSMRSPPPRPREVKLANLGDVRAFRNYVAVTGVEHAGEHFTAWSRDIEPSMVRVNVWRDVDGALVLAEEGGYWGGLGVAPNDVAAIPAQVEPLARQVQRELERRNPQARDWKLAYDGNFRSVRVYELIAHDDGAGTGRMGWSAQATLAMDASLSTIIKAVETTSGFGLIEVPADAQWVELARPGNGRTLLVTEPTPELAARIGAAAQRFEAHAPSPALASLVPPGGAMLPDGYVADVAAGVSIYGRIANGNGFARELRLPLDLGDAVFGGGASAESVNELEHRRYTVRVTLTPASRRDRSPGRARERYDGTLAVHVDDGEGHAWEHAYPASGWIERDGDQVVAPTGLSIPGASAPSQAWDDRHGELPGSGRIRDVDVYVDVGVFAEPRR